MSFRPTINWLLRLAGQTPPDVITAAVDRWEITPRETRRFPPAFVLPAHYDRIRGTEFATLPETIHALRADHDVQVPPTMGYLLRDADLVDGVIYANGAERHLRQQRRSLAFRRPEVELSGALYETWVGNRWFGNWLVDNGITYPLAAAAGNPVTTAPPGKGHVPRYEELLGMAPRRITDAHFRELILFDDMPQNTGKQARAAAMRDMLLAGRNPAPVPGVFLLRGRTGDQRLLENEDEIAGRLQADHGFTIIDATQKTVDELMDACGNARVIAGVEGSQLVHGMAVSPPGSTLFTIQPPDRVTAAMKLMTDRLDQSFALVVAEGNARNFRADWGDVARTLELLR
nr:glycosyltransferase family 61 protein [Fertoeibacter niger]